MCRGMYRIYFIDGDFTYYWGRFSQWALRARNAQLMSLSEAKQIAERKYADYECVGVV